MKPVMTQNKFLQSLPKDLLTKLDEHAEIVKVKRGDADRNSIGRFDHIYFPLNCVYSLEMPMSDGLASHLALLGYRHAIGARSLVDLEMPGVPRAIIPGYALRVRSEIFAAEMTRWPELRRAVHDQFVRVTAILAVTSGCNLRHPLQRRLARKLLGLNYVSGATSFELTHEDLAHFLGVRREAVTEALSRLSQAAAIKTSRGHIEIPDLGALQAFTCECSFVSHTKAAASPSPIGRLKIAGA
jgi:CRP-like cAMP-binding protein